MFKYFEHIKSVLLITLLHDLKLIWNVTRTK